MSKNQPSPEPEADSRQLSAHLYEIDISDVGNAFSELTSNLAELGEYDNSVILKFAKSIVKKFGLLDSLVPLMVFHVIEAKEILNRKSLEIDKPSQKKQKNITDFRLDSKRDEHSIKTVEEKKEYLIYSHEIQRKPYPASKGDVKELEELSLEEKGKRFDIYYNSDKKWIIIEGEKIEIAKKGTRASRQIPEFLKLILMNVGKTIGFDLIERSIWHSNTQGYDSDIGQLKKRFCRFTNHSIDSFIEIKSDLRVIFVHDFYESKRKFKYCLVLCSENI